MPQPFFLSKLYISEHSGSISISIKKGEKKAAIFLVRYRAEEGGGQSLADMSAKQLKKNELYKFNKIFTKDKMTGRVDTVAFEKI